MPVLSVFGSQDFTREALLDITQIKFAREFGGFATFNSAQFGGAGISDTVIVQGFGIKEMVQDQIRVNVTAGGTFSTAGWVFTDWQEFDFVNLHGTSSAEHLTGATSNTRFVSGGGADTLIGGAGNDDFVFTVNQALPASSPTARLTIDGGGGHNSLLIGVGITYDFSGAAITNLTGATFMGGTALLKFDSTAFGQGAISIVAANRTLVELSVSGGSFDFSSLDVRHWNPNSTFRLTGSGNADLLVAAAGADLSLGGAGDDTIRGEAGNDSLYGGDNNDFVAGGIGSDYLDGQGENDALYGGDSNDTVVGNHGDDYLDGQGENDELYGNDGRDIMVGNHGNDYLDGGDGNDELYGNDNNDILIGNLGDDYLDGQGELDTLYGGVGNDTLYGNVGNDQLWGGVGSDRLIGGNGDDQFRFALADLQAGVRDVIADFAEAGGGNADLLVFFGVAAGAVTTVAAGDGSLVSIAVAGGVAEILVQGFTPAQLADQIFFL